MFKRRRQAVVIGAVDDIRGLSLHGWAADQNALNVAMDVSVYADGVQLGRSRADEFRSDLFDLGFGDGKHGFTISLTNCPRSIDVLSVVASRADISGHSESTGAGAVPMHASVGARIARAILAQSQTIVIPPSLTEALQQVKAGRSEALDRTQDACKDVYLSDELFTKTLLAYAGSEVRATS